MTREPLQNVAASVRQRLLNKARATGRPFNELLQYYGMERFLYRLSQSVQADRFVLKGALMLATWAAAVTRPTKDIDLLGRMGNDVDRVVEAMKEVCHQEVEPDGMDFRPESMLGERIAEHAEYEGVRVRFLGYLGTARVSMQIDVGFGDAIVPGPVRTAYPTLLKLPAPELWGYTRESMIAEKFHTMVRRGLINSRVRDFFDVWILSRQFDFDGKVLAEAIRETFARREQEVDPCPVALTDEFAGDPARSAQWQGLLRTSRLGGAPGELSAVVSAIAAFLGPVAEALHEGRRFEDRWTAPGPWSAK